MTNNKKLTYADLIKHKRKSNSYIGIFLKNNEALIDIFIVLNIENKMTILHKESKLYEFTNNYKSYTIDNAPREIESVVFKEVNNILEYKLMKTEYVLQKCCPGLPNPKDKNQFLISVKNEFEKS